MSEIEVLIEKLQNLAHKLPEELNAEVNDILLDSINFLPKKKFQTLFQLLLFTLQSFMNMLRVVLQTGMRTMEFTILL
jgi:hypothetical protein